MGGQQGRARRPYSTGDAALDGRVAELVEAAGAGADADLLTQLITSCLRLTRDRADRGELKLVNGALKEFAYSFRVFRRYRGVRKVSMFGSSRSLPNDANFEYARAFAAAMAHRGWMVITGAGPGIMEAGHRGAGAERSFGANIRLPMEAAANEVIEGDPKLINFKYFFTRKITFLKESDAFALFPGGYGTLDEAFELLTLMQTGKSDLHPVVLLEAPGSTYWEEWRRLLADSLEGRGYISTDDLDLISMPATIEDAIAEIEGFYRNYHSERYVGGTLVLRVLRLPPPDELGRLAGEFADILRTPRLEAVEPSPQEVAENDALECQRIALDFNRGSFGRLRQLITALNQY